MMAFESMHKSFIVSRLQPSWLVVQIKLVCLRGLVGDNPVVEVIDLTMLPKTNRSCTTSHFANRLVTCIKPDDE